MRKILISGITGQDASYLAELLLSKGFDVYGTQRRASTIITERIDHIFESDNKKTFYADLADANSLINVILKVKPDEIYNLASQSHVRISFDIPEYTAQVTGVGALRWLEALRSLGMTNVKYLQTSSSEMFGISPPPQNEDTPMLPQSPYGVSKLFAYHMTKVYRVGYKMFACNSICFNHESERRAMNFVTQKIVYAAVNIKMGKQNKVRLGNLDAKRDWGFSGDYVNGMYLIMQHSIPDDFVLATSEQYSVREFAEKVFNQLGLNFNDHVEYDQSFTRPNEVPSLMGDSTKARTVLGWKPEVNFEGLVDRMIKGAWDNVRNNTQRLAFSEGWKYSRYTQGQSVPK